MRDPYTTNTERLANGIFKDLMSLVSIALFLIAIAGLLERL
jgi:hypothetical protein